MAQPTALQNSFTVPAYCNTFPGNKGKGIALREGFKKHAKKFHMQFH